MRFAADHSETLEVFFCLYVPQSVVCEMATMQERALCWMAF
jgi:hypothetical protein